MKIRNGFVSNSSSSSFIILGERLFGLPGTFEKGLWLQGADHGDGYDVFQVTQDIYDLIESSRCDRGQFRGCYQGAGMEDGAELSSKALPKKFRLHVLDRSMHSIDSTAQFISAYMPED